MSVKYPEFKFLDFTAVEAEVNTYWETAKVFERSIRERDNAPSFVFYEGPPSANGVPGIHHVMGRTIKDLFCRYKTMQGFKVNRKAGRDTHGLPVELGVEKSLGITKEDIGKKITVEEYNQKCREEVMKYQDKWEALTRMMGYWVDLKDPYITYDNNYIESLWWILEQFYKKGLLYKGLTIQPYSPAAGTGLSSHELNQPGCYKQVKDTTAVAMFELEAASQQGHAVLSKVNGPVHVLAWTTTPWTLPSNTALAVGATIDYVLIETINTYTAQVCAVICAKALVSKHFKAEGENLDFASYKAGDKIVPWKLVAEMKGADLVGLSYHQLLSFAANDVSALEGSNEAWRVIAGDFVTTEDGTGIVHIAPSFGADDFRVAKQNGIGALTMVDRRGKFLAGIQDGVYLFGEEYVKEAYLTDAEKQSAFQQQKQVLEAAGKVKELKAYLSVDTRIVLKLQEEGKLFKKENYEHSYPHCWRTDKPVLYYPLDSWFIAVTKVKESMVAKNKTINWKPEATGTGRFGNWLENANDWNLSRSRFWGTPLPIWRTEDGSEELVIGSLQQLTDEYKKAQAVGFNKDNNFVFKADGLLDIDLHKPFVDKVILLSSKGEPMKREADLIDVWFDSGAMPLAQWHYPFENESTFTQQYPADFIAEGVDQTRGWFYTLHAIAVMLHEIDPVKYPGIAYKNVVSNGLVLDKDGNKMSKRLGNAVDPFTTLPKYGADSVRWYMVENANPWDNLKFDPAGVDETRRKFFGTLYNTYSFFALYANVDGFSYKEAEVPLAERPEIDRWIISLLNTLKGEVKDAFEDYEPTKAARAIQTFVDEHLSNWYVRLCRRRFWKGEYVSDKIAAYQTLYQCLETISRLMAPIAPFFGEWLYRNLNQTTQLNTIDSVHLTAFPSLDTAAIDKALEERMQMAQDVSSLVLSLRKKVNIKVRQPLQQILVPSLNDHFTDQLKKVEALILSEVNVKELKVITEDSGVIKKKIKANFKSLGARLGAKMKGAAAAIGALSQSEINSLERLGHLAIQIEGEEIHISMQDVEILAEDLAGWQVATKAGLTVALDITISQTLENEGIARELVNQIQRLRKDSDLKVTDRINVTLEQNTLMENAINEFSAYICDEILADKLTLSAGLTSDHAIDINETRLKIIVQPLN